MSVSGGTLSINANSWSGAGTISISSGTLNLGSTFTTAQLVSTLTHSGGTVRITGTLNNAGATLNVGSGTALGALTLAGNLVNGTIIDAGAGLVVAGGGLTGVTYQGTLDMSAASATLYTGGGFTGGVGGATINLTGSNGSLWGSTETLDGATLNIGSSGGDYLLVYNQGAQTLTLGSHLTVNQVGGNAVFVDGFFSGTSGSGPGNIVNAGTINAGFGGGNFWIGYNGSGGGSFFQSGFDLASFTNQGAINVSNGDTLTINATSFTNTGALNANGGNIAVTVAETGAGNATIYGTSRIQYNAASNDNVTFALGSTGELILLNSAAYSGTISGFTGSGTGAPATSDKIDLKDINFSSPNFTKSY